jgi:hypothetical protein
MQTRASALTLLILSLVVTLVPSVAVAAPPSNDNFPGTTITGLSGSIAGTNVDSTTEPGEDFEIGGSTVWYSWTAPDTGDLTLDLCDAAFDAYVAVYIGEEVATTTFLFEGDEGCPQPGPTRMTFPVVQDYVYRIQVASYFAGDPEGSFTMAWNLAVPPPPSNDNFPGATLGGSNGSVAGTTHGASTEIGEYTLDDSTVWYSWTAPASGTVTLDTCTTDFDTFVQVLVATSASDVQEELAAVDEGCPVNSGTLLTFEATGGVTYRFHVATYAGLGDGNFTLTYSLEVPLDTTDPTITITTPPNNAPYTQGQVVNADFSCSDLGGSGIASCVGTVADGSPIDTSTVGPHSFTVDAADVAGNTATLTHNYTVNPPPDTTDPTITITTPPNNATYTQGQVVNADFSCSDLGGSGIASCVGTVANGSPIDTSSVGPHSFTVNAADVAGNTATLTHNYTVNPPPDTTDPNITITTPPNNATYTQGQVVTAD